VADLPSLKGERYTLAWFCIDSLLETLRALRRQKGTEERLHRLYLTLISAISSLPLTLLPRVLDEVRTIIVTHGPAAGAGDKVGLSAGGAGTEGGGRKGELTQALFEEILQRVANREKEFVLRWWYDNREQLGWRETPANVAQEAAFIPSRL
jgi:hypothetical protein